jgi:serine protease Do
MKKILLLIGVIILLLAAVFNRSWPELNKSTEELLGQKQVTTKVVSEESLVISAVKKALPAVVTVQIKKTTTTGDIWQLNPFDPFGGFQIQPGEEETLEQSIGSGFVVEPDGLIITNKHVVADTEAEYKVITSDEKTYSTSQIWRDPLNDLAIVKIEANNLPTLDLGDSNSLVLGQIAIAIGTPLGEFRNTVTSGIISGIGRGITAGSPYESFVERLDNVIQTDAAINPGNSGGPLLNSNGEVIGINTAVSQEGQNIGFAIPVNVVKELLKNYRESGGKISRPFLGVRYKVLDKDTAIMNDLPEGAYIVEVIENSNAAKAGLKKGQVISKIDDTRITKENDITSIIRKHKVGDSLRLEIWSEGQKISKTIVLGQYE